MVIYLEGIGANVKGIVSLYKGKRAGEKLGITDMQIAAIEKLIGRRIVEDTINRKLEDLSLVQATALINNKNSFSDPVMVLERVQSRRYSIKENMSDGERYEELKDAVLSVAAFDESAGALRHIKAMQLISSLSFRGKALKRALTSKQTGADAIRTLRKCFLHLTVLFAMPYLLRFIRISTPEQCVQIKTLSAYMCLFRHMKITG